MLLGFWNAFSGLGIYSKDLTQRLTLEARDAAASVLQSEITVLQKRMLDAEKKIHPVTSVVPDETIRLAFRDQIRNSESIEVFGADLSAAYERMPGFGAGKLAVLESTLNGDGVAIRIIQSGGDRKLALARALGVQNERRLVLVILPLDTLESFMDVDSPESSYLAVRQGQVDFLAKGGSQPPNLDGVSARPLTQTPWSVVAAAPPTEGGMLDARGYGEFALSMAFLFLALACWILPKRFKMKYAKTGAEEVELEPELTLAQMKAKGVLSGAAAENPPDFNITDAHQSKVPLERSIFRAYDIRGIVGENLDSGIACLIGEAIGSILVERGLAGIVVGYDGRLSSPKLAAGLVDGLASTGVSVINIGCAPTPLVYFAANRTDYSSCISVTGSHNPPDYNGFKIVIDGHTLSGDEITAIFERIVQKQVIQSKISGTVVERDMMPDYISYVEGDIQLDRPLKVVVDCGNGAAGKLAPALLRAIGAEVEDIYCDIDGNFPNHHPDPSNPDNLIDLINAVRHTEADLGLAFDGDGDRLGVVTAGGEIIFPDSLLMLFAEDVLTRQPGAAIIYDVKCTGALNGHILRHGGSPLMWKTGHSLIKAKMKEVYAELAGEMSGHFFFAERWFGFDDGIYAAARLLEILAAAPDGVQAVFDALPKPVSTPELKVKMNEGEQYAFIESFVARAHFEGARINLIDGLRADWPDGWGLVRASNTTPVLVVRFEANDEQSIERIKNAFREQLLEVNNELQLPF